MLALRGRPVRNRIRDFGAAGAVSLMPSAQDRTACGRIEQFKLQQIGESVLGLGWGLRFQLLQPDFEVPAAGLALCQSFQHVLQ